MQKLAPIAFVAEPRENAAIAVLVNFGIFAGREVTPAEIDDLARILLDEVGSVSVVSEARHEIDRDVEVSVHQVRIEVDRADLPDDADVGALSARVALLAEHWADGCISERHAEISDS